MRPTDGERDILRELEADARSVEESGPPEGWVDELMAEVPADPPPTPAELEAMFLTMRDSARDDQEPY